MPHTYVASYFHLVFSTKDRKKLITEEIEPRLYPYLGGIARRNNFKVLAVGGIPDHVHLLVSLPATVALAKAVQLLKGNSSHWINIEFSNVHRFEWQSGYGAFSVGIGDLERTRNYIVRQKEHHLTSGSASEMRAFLNKHGFS